MLRQLYAPWNDIPHGLPLLDTFEHLCTPFAHDAPLLGHLPLLKSWQRTVPSRSVAASVPGVIFGWLDGGCGGKGVFLPEPF